MSTIALNNNINNHYQIPNLGSFQDKSQFISINDYNKLKLKYESKAKENKKLKDYLENIMKSYETMSESKKSVEGIFETIKEIIKNNKYFSKSKEEFSTSYSHCEYLGSIDMKTSAKSCNCSSININIKDYFNQNLLRKIEEMENSYNEILQNFDLLASKYKLVKEENVKLQENNITLVDQISALNEDFNNLFGEFNEANITIQRFKEIDKCLVDSTISSLFLNTNEKKQLAADSGVINSKNIQNNDKEDKNRNFSYVLCEPVPTFVKFINKFTK